MLNEKQKERLSILIEDSYGSPNGLAKHLDLGIEMLFYLEEDTFEQKDIHSVVSGIRGIVNVLREEETSLF